LTHCAGDRDGNAQLAQVFEQFCQARHLCKILNEQSSTDKECALSG
jgi:hypothetical protein